MNVLAIDFGTGWTSALLKDNEMFSFKSIWNKNPQCHIFFLKNLITKYEINILIYEGSPTIHQIRDTSSFKAYWKIFEKVISFSQTQKVDGCPFFPWEVRKYRDEIRKYKWIVEKELRETYAPYNCHFHPDLKCHYKCPNMKKLYDRAEQDGYEWIGEKRRNELDAQCLFEMWQAKVRNNDTVFLEKRNQIHYKKLIYKLIRKQGRNKTNRLNNYKEKCQQITN